MCDAGCRQRENISAFHDSSLLHSGRGGMVIRVCLMRALIWNQGLQMNHKRTDLPWITILGRFLGRLQKRKKTDSNEPRKVSSKLTYMVKCDVNVIIKCILLTSKWFNSCPQSFILGTAGLDLLRQPKHTIFIVKTVFSRSPKKWLEAEMRSYPGGTCWVVLEGIPRRECPWSHLSTSTTLIK